MSTLDIDTVEAFLLVAELQSFTRAAEALGTTQAAVSMKLQRLESVVGKRLVERSPRAVALTAAGAAFLPHARALIEAHDRALSGERPARQPSAPSTRPASHGPRALSAAASPPWSQPLWPALRSRHWPGGSRRRAWSTSGRSKGCRDSRPRR